MCSLVKNKNLLSMIFGRIMTNIIITGNIYRVIVLTLWIMSVYHSDQYVIAELSRVLGDS